MRAQICFLLQPPFTAPCAGWTPSPATNSLCRPQKRSLIYIRLFSPPSGMRQPLIIGVISPSMCLRAHQMPNNKPPYAYDSDEPITHKHHTLKPRQAVIVVLSMGPYANRFSGAAGVRGGAAWAAWAAVMAVTRRGCRAGRGCREGRGWRAGRGRRGCRGDVAVVADDGF